MVRPFSHFHTSHVQTLYPLSYLGWASPLPILSDLVCACHLQTFILDVCKPFAHFLTWCVQALYPYFHTKHVQPFYPLSYLMWAHFLPTFILCVCKPCTFFHMVWNVFTYFHTWYGQALYPLINLVCKPFTHFHTKLCSIIYPLSYLAVFKSFTHFHTWHVQAPLSYLVCAKKRNPSEPAWLPRPPWGCMDGLLEDTQSKVLAHSQFPSYLTL